MKPISKIAVIGAGGIGRMLALLLNDYSGRNLPYFNQPIITWFDDDTVEEQNQWSQGFSVDAVTSMLDKVDALKEEFDKLRMIPKAQRVTNMADLASFDAVFIAVDNLETRKAVYEYCFKTGKWFVDARVNGKNLFIADANCNRQELTESLEAGSEAGPTSCLYAHEKQNKILHATPAVAAACMIQFYLNYTRGVENSILELAL